jgi:hypothetical protein
MSEGTGRDYRVGSFCNDDLEVEMGMLSMATRNGSDLHSTCSS